MEESRLLVMINIAQKWLYDLEASSNKDAIDRQKTFLKRLLDRHDRCVELLLEKIASGMTTSSKI